MTDIIFKIPKEEFHKIAARLKNDASSAAVEIEDYEESVDVDGMLLQFKAYMNVNNPAFFDFTFFVEPDMIYPDGIIAFSEPFWLLDEQTYEETLNGVFYRVWATYDEEGEIASTIINTH